MHLAVNGIAATSIGIAPDEAAGGTVVVIDDQATSRQILTEMVRKTLDVADVQSFTAAAPALEWARNHAADLIIADYKMPEMDGIEFTRRFRATPNGADVPVVIVTIVEDRSVRYRALEAGATDFLTKPVDQHECAARCRNLLTLRHQQRIIKDRARSLEEQVQLATEEVRDREREALLRLAKAGEFRDEDTGNHVLRVTRYARIIADDLGLPSDEAEMVSLAAALHDIGKVGIPDGILRKTGAFTKAERLLMCEHTRIGYDILKDSPSKYLQTGAIIALCHHERFDGTGYPDGLIGDDIPMPARIVAVADVFDALTSRRPYKHPWGASEAFAYLREESRKHFDPLCVEIFLANRDLIIAIQRELQDSTST